MPSIGRQRGDSSDGDGDAVRLRGVVVRPLWRCRSCSSAALGSTAAESPHAPHARPWELPPRLRADPVHTSPHATSQRRSTTSAAPAPLQMP